MNEPQDRQSVYNDYPVWKDAPQAVPVPTTRHKLSPRAKAGIAVGGVALAATGIVCWSQYETAQAADHVREAQLSLQQAQVQLAIEQQQAEVAKAGGQETAAQKARREAMEKCIAAAGSSYNGVADCASAYPVVDSTGGLGDSQATASTSSTNSPGSPVGLVVLGGVGLVLAGGWVKKRVRQV